MQQVAVIDYGMGNLHSVTKALQHVSDADTKIVLTSSKQQIADADKVVFPGQGAARDCMAAIDEHDLRESIINAAINKPFLGICMGLQVLVEYSEENNGTECLAVFPGRVRFFGEHLTDAEGARLKVPHMGWNQVQQTRDHPLWQGIADNSRFYFVHSYYLETEAPDLETGHCVYGQPFTCAIASENVFAIQCHPEKSAESGLKLLTNFLSWTGNS